MPGDKTRSNNDSLPEGSRRLRAGVVGTGYLGAFHAEKYASMDGVVLAGVADIDESRAASVAGKCHTRAFRDYKELVGLVDAVSIATPTPLHFEVALFFLENGVDVLVEKPITTTVEEADRLIETAARKGRILQVGHLERFNPAVMAVWDQIKDPVFIESNRLAIYQPRGTEVSVVHDLMIHDIDLILTFVASPVSSCHALGTPVVTRNVDIANAHLVFENGAVANVTASRISNKSERKIRIFQKDGYIAIDFANREVTRIRKAKDDENCPIPGMHLDKYSFSQGDALAAEIGSFADAVRYRKRPVVTGEMGRAALELASGIVAQINKAMETFLK